MEQNGKSLLEKITSAEYFIPFFLLISLINIIFPYKFPFFALLFFIYFFIFFVTKRLGLRVNFYIIIILLNIYFYFFGLLWNNGILYKTNISEIENIVFLILSLFCIREINLGEYQNLIDRFFKLVCFFIPFLATIGLYKYAKLLNGTQLRMFIVDGRSYPIGTSLMPDYNMFALGMLIGLVCLISYFYKTQSLIFKIYLFISIFIVSSSIFFSGSRRGWILLGIYLLYFLFTLFRSIFRVYQTKLNKKIYIAIGVSLFILIVFLYNFSINITNSYELEKLEYRFSTLSNTEASLGSRTARWDYAIEILKKSNIFQLAFGQGFEYLRLFGNNFSELNEEDYPHNFLLSSIIYSGIVGGILNILMVVIPPIILFKKRRKLGIELNVIYLTTLIFCFISGNSIFSSRVLILLIILISSASFIPNQLNDRNEKYRDRTGRLEFL